LRFRHRITAYDARFLVLADQLGSRLITEDARLRAAAPALTQSLAERSPSPDGRQPTARTCLMNFFAELKRRKVFKVGAAYLIVAWLAVQAASIGFPAFDAPPWALRILS